MSISLMAAIWDNGDEDLTGSRLNVMLCLADRADQDGYCWPSMADISRRCRMSQRNAIYVVQQLEHDGYLSVSRMNGKSNRYLVRATREGDFTSETGFTSANQRKPVKPASPPPVKPASPESSIESPVEPSFAPSADLLAIFVSDDDDTIPEPEPAKPSKPPTAQQAMIGAVAEVCAMDLKIPSAAKSAGKAASELVKAGYVPQQVQNFGRWWASSAWRKEKTPVPKPHQLLSDIAQGANYANGRASPPPELPDPPAQVKARELRQKRAGGVREV